MIGVMIAYSIMIVGMPFTAFFDTFLAPVVVFLLFKDMRDERAIRFFWLIHAMMMLNAIIGIGEFITGERLTPIIANGMVIDDDWRSSALLGHPLANASLTGAYLLAMARRRGRGFAETVRRRCFLVNAAAMVVFGGRASSVILLAILGVLAARGRFSDSARRTLRQVDGVNGVDPHSDRRDCRHHACRSRLLRALSRTLHR